MDVTAATNDGTAITRDGLGKTIQESPEPDVAERCSGNRLGDLSIDSVYALEAREGLSALPDASVDCIVTSPPYWWARDYQVPEVAWSDGSVAALGLESDIESYVEHLVEVFDAAWRVLKETGTLWLNLGDVYASGTRARRGSTLSHHRAGRVPARPGSAFDALPKKTLCMIPERLALRMLERDWILRNKIVWHKPNYLPASVYDRFACGWEYVFLFSKAHRYYFDLDAVRVPHLSPVRSARTGHRHFRPSPHVLGNQRPPRVNQRGGLHPLGKNPGDCWIIATRGSPQPHPAIYPEALCERPIKAGCPAGALVLDPFCGTGTTCVVAQRLGRHYLGFDASPRYAAIARERLKNARTQPGEPRAPPEGGESPC